MSRDTVQPEDSRWLHRHRPYVRFVVAIGVVLFALWNFSISARVIPKDQQLTAEVVMLDSYLAEGESAVKSAVATISAVANVVASSLALNNTVQEERVDEERSEYLSLSTNSSLSMVHEKRFELSSVTSGKSSTAVTSSNSNSIHNTSVTSPPASATDYDKEGLPAWITDYFAWHNQMRQQFPDKEIYEHDDAPKVLLKYCKWLDRVICGGLYDRMATIPKMLYVANQTNRVLLIKWYVPTKLETFLLPVAINWTAPDHDRLRSQNFFRNNLQKPKYPKNQTFLSWASEKPAVEEHMLVVHREANPFDLKKELLALDETDTVENTSTFGILWRAMFRPAPLVQDEIDATMKSLGLESGKYSATHCRVRHPGRFVDNLALGKNGSQADVSGLPWHGPNKEMALASATRALKCTQWLSKSTEEPVYFYSDSEDLVHQLLVEQNQIKTGTTPTLLAENNETKAARKRLSVLRTTKLSVRDVSKWPTAHLDRQLGLPAEAYVSTFVDLYIAASARCIAFGVGNFGYLAAKISGTKCVVLYEGQHTRGQARMWNQQNGGARKCPVK
jgi:hypothetical protein